MASKARTCARCTQTLHLWKTARLRRHYASAAATATAISPTSSIEHMNFSPPPIIKHNPTQPPSFKRPEFRRTQLLRQYASLIQSSPLMIFYQHTSLKATEWMGMRRELAIALKKVDAQREAKGMDMASMADKIRIQVIHTGIFYMALRIVEYYGPKNASGDGRLMEVVSRQAYDAASTHEQKHPLEPLLNGPLALLTMPSVSPEYLKAAFSILSPQAPLFSAPRKRVAPGLYELGVQAGIRKLLLLGARVEGETFDFEGARWVGSIEGGIDGLRGQLVAMLQSLGANVTNTLQSASSNLWLTMESRRSVLEEEQKPKEEIAAIKEEGV